MSQRSSRGARSVRTFRPGALALPLAVLPLAIGWGMGFYGTPPEGVSPVALGAHWIVDWLMPACVAAVLSFGTGAMGIDHRIAAGGPRDIRRLWWETYAPIVIGAVVACLVGAFWLARWSGEPFLALAVPALAGMAVAVVAAQVVVARFGAGPSLALGLSVAVVAAVTIVPYLVSGVPWLAIDGTLYIWIWTGPQRIATWPALLTWLAIAGTAVFFARRQPRDVAALTWLAREVAIDD
jgi:hypothetical protein